jgi:hypothetical protein
VGNLIKLSCNHDIARIPERHVVANKIDYAYDSNHEAANELSDIIRITL